MFRRPFIALSAASLLATLFFTADAAPRWRKQAPSLQTITLSHAGEDRSYELYRPSAITEASAVVIMLHGGGGNGRNAAKMTGFNALADAEGFTVVYPNGTGRGMFLTWNGGHCCQFAMRTDVDDVGFLSAVIDDLIADGIADRRRIYVTGMSNGAMMAHQLGREVPHKVAAIAPVVGAMFGDEAIGASPVPTLIITGAKDENVPAAGGYGVLPAREQDPPNDAPYAPAETAFKYWMTTNACKQEARPQTTKTYKFRAGYVCKAPVSWYHLSRSGHAWPGGEKGHRRGDAPMRDFDASAVMWDFFEPQSLAK